MPGKRDPSKALLQVWVDRDELEAAREKADGEWPEPVREWLREYTG